MTTMAKRLGLIGAIAVAAFQRILHPGWIAFAGQPQHNLNTSWSMASNVKRERLAHAYCLNAGAALAALLIHETDFGEHQ